MEFKNVQDIKNWINKKAKEYGSLNEFYSSPEYKKEYPNIKKIYDAERKRIKEEMRKEKEKEKKVVIVKGPSGKYFGLKLIDKKNTFIAPVGGPYGGLFSSPYPFKSEKEARDYAKKYKYEVVEFNNKSEVEMKEEIKQLYKKDSKLAHEVAKVLGYKIRSKNEDYLKKEDGHRISEIFSKIDKQSSVTGNQINKLYKYREYKEFYKFVEKLKNAHNDYLKVLDDMDDFLTHFLIVLK